MRFWITLLGLKMGVTRLIDDDNPMAERAPPYGVAYASNRSYHCPQCGSLWAVWQREDAPDLEWYPSRRSCPNHATGLWQGDKPGSLILYPSDIAVVPREVLQREVML